MRGKPHAPRPPTGLALSPGLQQAFSCTTSHSGLKGQFQLSIAGCLEGKGLEGNTFRESSPISISTQATGGGQNGGASPLRGR